jgi:hypothetical protein
MICMNGMKRAGNIWYQMKVARAFFRWHLGRSLCSERADPGPAAIPQGSHLSYHLWETPTSHFLHSGPLLL